MPGQWARLSNTSEDGKWLRTETFRVGSKEVVHTKGASAGRALEAYRKVRKSHPDLVAQLDIMSQPASNVDSVILSWACSMWQRDCFSSVFADSAVQSMAAAQQVSCLVAAKCTSKLQITDSDFAKQFKAFVRKKLLALRREFQHAQKNTSSVFKVGALEIVTSVAWAQQEMTAGRTSGLSELEGDLALELAANAENCLSLSLHPRLRRAALRQAAEEGFAEQRKTRQGNLKIRKVRQLLRDSMRSKLVKALREKVALSNRAEALRSIVPQAQGKKGSAKTSKPSATSKPSIKDKG